MSDLEKYLQLFPFLLQIQELAYKQGIVDIFQDNGGKVLEIVSRLGLKVVPGRNGNDVFDLDGRECEVKTVNAKNKKSPTFTTHHHMNPNIIEKYKQIPWYFAVYHDIELQTVYRLEPEQLGPYVARWTEQYNERQEELNNPKIPLKFVKSVGQIVWNK